MTIEGKNQRYTVYDRLLSRAVICGHTVKSIKLRSIKLTVVKVVVSSEGTRNNCLFVVVFNYFLDLVTKYLIFLQAICDF